jgi:hypothetical protein
MLPLEYIGLSGLGFSKSPRSETGPSYQMVANCTSKLL